MAGIYFIDRRTAEERAADHQRWIDQHYLEEGKAYTFELHKYWDHGWVPCKVYSWTVHIKQADCPWMGVACNSFTFPGIIPFAGLIARTRAIIWAKAYLKRGGPPEGYFRSAAPDPNRVVFSGRGSAS